MPPARPKAELEEENKAIIQYLFDVFTALKKEPRLPKLSFLGGTEQDCYGERTASGRTLGDHLADTSIAVINELRERQGCPSRINGKDSLITQIFSKRLFPLCGWDDPINFALMAEKLGVEAGPSHRRLRELSFEPRGASSSLRPTRPASPLPYEPVVVEATETEAEPSVTRMGQQEA